MPVSEHKLLVYSEQITKHVFLAIGQFTEDVQESRHTKITKFQEVERQLLKTSDHLINSYRTKIRKPLKRSFFSIVGS